MRETILTLVVLLFMLCGTAFGQTQTIPDHYEIFTYWDTSGSSFTGAWSKSSGDVVEYEWEAVQPEKNFAVLARGTVPQQDNPQFIVKLNKAGHYILRVRACDASGNCSDWTESTDPTHEPMVGTEVKPWMIYLYLAAPSF